MRCLLPFLLLAALLGAPSSAEVTMDWITVSDPNNPCDSQGANCFGSMGELYRISKFEVTNAQYAEFLNAVAATDTNALYHANMGSGDGGITQSGSAGSHSYSTIAGRADMPVNYITFWNAARFANWLHNGQPTGAQDDTTTEDGAYELTPNGIMQNTVTRKAGATVFVPSEDEWYKAAYYYPGHDTYFDYPAGSNAATGCEVPGSAPNTANCESDVGDLTDVGSYTGTPSPSGTFDQGGNVREWNDTILVNGLSRGCRGGNFGNSFVYLAASLRTDADPDVIAGYVGFRVASTMAAPSVAVPSLGMLAAALASGLLGLAGLRRLRG